jgi:hypothetical protein
MKTLVSSAFGVASDLDPIAATVAHKAIAGAGSVRISPTTSTACAAKRTGSLKCASSHEQADFQPVWAARCSSTARWGARFVGRPKSAQSHP